MTDSDNDTTKMTGEASINSMMVKLDDDVQAMLPNIGQTNPRQLAVAVLALFNVIPPERLDDLMTERTATPINDFIRRWYGISQDKDHPDQKLAETIIKMEACTLQSIRMTIQDYMEETHPAEQDPNSPIITWPEVKETDGDQS